MYMYIYTCTVAYDYVQSRNCPLNLRRMFEVVGKLYIPNDSICLCELCVYIIVYICDSPRKKVPKVSKNFRLCIDL